MSFRSKKKREGEYDGPVTILHFTDKQVAKMHKVADQMPMIWDGRGLGSVTDDEDALDFVLWEGELGIPDALMKYE